MEDKTINNLVLEYNTILLEKVLLESKVAKLKKQLARLRAKNKATVS